jgi:hypothetical protein
MTVGELRRLLTEYEEDAEVMVSRKLGRDQVTFDLGGTRDDHARTVVFLDAVIPRRWL